jgi:hypothetical protein
MRPTEAAAGACASAEDIPITMLAGIHQQSCNPGQEVPVKIRIYDRVATLKGR